MEEITIDDVIAVIVLLCFFSFIGYIAFTSSRRDVKKWVKANGYKLKDCKLISLERRITVFAITVINKKGRELKGEATVTSTFPGENVQVTWDRKKKRSKK